MKHDNHSVVAAVPNNWTQAFSSISVIIIIISSNINIIITIIIIASKYSLSKVKPPFQVRHTTQATYLAGGT